MNPFGDFSQIILSDLMSHRFYYKEVCLNDKIDRVRINVCVEQQLFKKQLGGSYRAFLEV
jgi:hypothetical protein